MKAVKKILFYVFLAVTVLIAAFTGSVLLFKDRILQEFIDEANKSLGTPVDIGQIEISAWDDFPNLAITFKDVYVEDSHKQIYPLFKAKMVSFSLNAIDAINGKYSIQGLKIDESETHLKVDKNGLTNFAVFKETKKAASDNIGFDLHKVKLTKTNVIYQDVKLRQHHEFESKDLIASVKNSNRIYHIEAEGDVTIGKIAIKTLSLLEKKSFDVNAVVDYDDKNKNVGIRKSMLSLGKSDFEVEGDYNFKDRDMINVAINGKNTTIQTVLSLLPEKLTENVKEYESRGDMYFTMVMKGEVQKPLMTVSFGCKNASIFHPNYKSRIEEANLQGSFASPELTDFSKAEIFLKNFSGKLNGKQFKANLSIQNFDDPNVALEFKGDIDAASIQNFYPIENVREISGAITTEFSIQGRTSLLKKKSTAQQVLTSGSLELKNISFTSGAQHLHFEDINGVLHFDKADIAMSNVGGRLDRSDFLLNGFLKNVITYVLFENQPIGIEADLKSNFLDLDELFAFGIGVSGSKDFGFSISPNLHLNFNCDVKAMKYKRFAPRDIKGDLLVKNQVAVSRHLAFKAMGGLIEGGGIVEAKNKKVIDVSSAFQLNGIHIDSVFYVFENFHQGFIEARHLKGQTNATVGFEMALDEKLKLFSETLTADISALIKNGELNNFEPMQKLNKYVDDDALHRLRFADLKNDIHIENKTIFIPQMEVRSNASNISLSGTHTFDQHIDYRVIAPLRSKKKIDPDEVFGAIEESGGQTKIFLKIGGSTDKYDVSLDKRATKQKMVSDLKREVKELKEAFQSRGAKKKKEVELQKDEYFDWDN
ncbi:MAG TPA: AsmA-like C-terminal region-containing protein [Cyclobacteriaceae bacterium]|nr:AsmA-like C-terminal region-containing protein [Cyclobacteriaceae bacterium]